MAKKNADEGKRGRPRVASKKKPYQVMLDPRYVKHVKAFAKTQGLTIQDLFRLTMACIVPSPDNPSLLSFDQIAILREKAIAFATSQSLKGKPLRDREGVAEDRRP
jgi:hypothetical protein